jgi:hypothetical protein
MNVLPIRSGLAIALSCWLGFLACILGCAMPLSTSTSSCDKKQISAGATAAGKQDSDLACCHHNRSSSESHKHNPNDGSCCTMNVTLTQKNDQSPSLVCNSHAVETPLAVTNASLAFHEVSVASLWPTGRDVLLQARVLRI